MSHLLERGFWQKLLNPVAAPGARSEGVSGRDRFTLDELRNLYDVLIKNPIVHEGNRATVVETIRSIAEFMIWGDQNEPRVFEFFLENNIMAYLHRVLLQPANRSGDVAKQVLQTLSIIVQNIASETGTYFLFSNDHVNNIIEIAFDFEHEEVLGFYISLLKAISLKLSKRTAQFFVRVDDYGNVLSFPLYSAAVRFAHHKEGMVRAGVRTMLLNIFSVSDPYIDTYVTQPGATHYLTNVAHYLVNHIQILDRRMQAAEAFGSQALSTLDSQLAEVEDILSYSSDVLGVGHPYLAHLLAQQLWTVVIGPLLLAPLLEQPSDPLQAPGPTTLRPACALYVLERCFQLVSYPPLINNMLLALFGRYSLPAGRSLPAAVGAGAATHNSSCPGVQGVAAWVEPASGQQLPDTGVDGYSTCREGFAAALHTSGVHAANNALRALVAVARSSQGSGGASAALLCTLGLLPQAQVATLEAAGAACGQSGCAVCDLSAQLTAEQEPGAESGSCKTAAGPFLFMYRMVWSSYTLPSLPVTQYAEQQNQLHAEHQNQGSTAQQQSQLPAAGHQPAEGNQADVPRQSANAGTGPDLISLDDEATTSPGGNAAATAAGTSNAAGAQQLTASGQEPASLHTVDHLLDSEGPVWGPIDRTLSQDEGPPAPAPSVVGPSLVSGVGPAIAQGLQQGAVYSVPAGPTELSQEPALLAQLAALQASQPSIAATADQEPRHRGVEATSRASADGSDRSLAAEHAPSALQASPPAPPAASAPPPPAPLPPEPSSPTGSKADRDADAASALGQPGVSNSKPDGLIQDVAIPVQHQNIFPPASGDEQAQVSHLEEPHTAVQDVLGPPAKQGHLQDLGFSPLQPEHRAVHPPTVDTAAGAGASATDHTAKSGLISDASSRSRQAVAGLAERLDGGMARDAAGTAASPSLADGSNSLLELQPSTSLPSEYDLQGLGTQGEQHGGEVGSAGDTLWSATADNGQSTSGTHQQVASERAGDLQHLSATAAQAARGHSSAGEAEAVVPAEATPAGPATVEPNHQLPACRADDLLDALFALLSAPLLPVPALWNVAYLLAQYCPIQPAATSSSTGSGTSSQSAAGCQLSAGQQRLLQCAVEEAASRMLDELSGMWCDAIFPLLCMDWGAAAEAVSRPILRANAEALMAGPALYPPRSDAAAGTAAAGRQNAAAVAQMMGLSMSAAAALHVYHAVQRLVAMLQLKQLLGEGKVSRQPPLPTPPNWDQRNLDIGEGQQVDLQPTSAIPCIVSFQPGQERRVYFSISGAALACVAEYVTGASINENPNALATVFHSSAAVVLADPAPTKLNSGVIAASSPLMGAEALVDKKVAKWVHVHVRPSVRGLLRVLRTAPSKKGGVLGAMRQLADGHWVLAFPDADRSAAACRMVKQQADQLRSLYADLLGPLLS